MPGMGRGNTKGGGEQQRPLKKKNVFLILEGKLLLAARRKPVYCPDLHGFDLEGTSRTCTLLRQVRKAYSLFCLRRPGWIKPKHYRFTLTSCSKSTSPPCFDQRASLDQRHFFSGSGFQVRSWLKLWDCCPDVGGGTWPEVPCKHWHMLQMKKAALKWEQVKKKRIRRYC